MVAEPQGPVSAVYKLLRTRADGGGALTPPPNPTSGEQSLAGDPMGMKLWIPIALMLTGCAALDTAKVKGAQLADKVLTEAIFVKCQAASIGSIDRRYMQSPETWALWYGECKTSAVPTME